MRTQCATVALMASLGLAPLAGAATLFEWLGLKKTPAAITALTEEQIIPGLKEALAQGVQHAVTSLGRDGGFLQDAQVKIPLPDSLKTVEKTLRALQQNQLADEFIATMNRAAEQEKLIRENPVARTTEVLQKVFGSLKK